MAARSLGFKGGAVVVGGARSLTLELQARSRAVVPNACRLTRGSGLVFPQGIGADSLLQMRMVGAVCCRA